MKSKLALSSVAGFMVGGLLFPLAAVASPINIASQEMNFGATSGTNQPAHIGVKVPQGFTHRYDDVFSGVDAVATIVNVTNINSGPNTDTVPDGLVDFFDESSSTSGKAINVEIDIFGDNTLSESGSVTIRVDFVAADTNNAVTLQNIAMQVVDIDSLQYATFAGISSYELSSGVSPSTATELTVSTTGGAYEFKEPANASSNNVDEENWVAVNYASADSITFILGARKSGGAFFGVSFVDASWPATPVLTSVSLIEYSLTYNTNSATSGSAPATQNSTSIDSSVFLSAAQGNLLRTNCTFGGWNTLADGTGANYQNGGSITLTANTTLFAKWTCVTPSQASASTPVSVTPAVALAATGWNALGVSIVTGVLLAAGLASVGTRQVLARKK